MVGRDDRGGTPDIAAVQKLEEFLLSPGCRMLGPEVIQDQNTCFAHQGIEGVIGYFRGRGIRRAEVIKQVWDGGNEDWLITPQQQIGRCCGEMGFATAMCS